MSQLRYRIGYKASTKEVQVKRYSEALTGGFTSWGDFYHDNVAVAAGGDVRGTGLNHVIWHEVRDACYAHGILDMQSISILFDEVVNAVSISTLPATKTLDLSSEPTVQLVTTFTPTDTTDQRLTYVSSDPTKATVSDTGLVTALVVGSTTITVTSREGAKTDTCVVTVQA